MATSPILRRIRYEEKRKTWRSAEKLKAIFGFFLQCRIRLCRRTVKDGVAKANRLPGVASQIVKLVHAIPDFQIDAGLFLSIAT